MISCLLSNALKQNPIVKKAGLDMLEAADAGCAMVLVVLDLSAALDTIDHAVLLSKFSNTFGVTGTALNLMKSYLTTRFSFVKIGSISLSAISLDTAVPQ